MQYKQFLKGLHAYGNHHFSHRQHHRMDDIGSSKGNGIIMESCMFCGDNCGSEVCYGCEDTADMLGMDIDELMESM